MRLFKAVPVLLSLGVLATVACSSAPGDDGEATAGAFASAKSSKDAGGGKKEGGSAAFDGGGGGGEAGWTPQDDGGGAWPDGGGACGLLDTCCEQMATEGYPGDAADCRGHANTNNSATCSTWLGQYRSESWCD